MMTFHPQPTGRSVSRDNAHSPRVLGMTDPVYVEAEESSAPLAFDAEGAKESISSESLSDRLIARYFGDVRRFALLNREAEKGLWAQIERARARSRRALCTSPVALATLSRMWRQVENQDLQLEYVVQATVSAEGRAVELREAIARLEQLHLALQALQGQRQERRRLWQQWLTVWESVALSPDVYAALQSALEMALRAAPDNVALRAASMAWSRAQRQLAIAKERILEANLRLVIYVARRYRNSGLPLLDLIQEGNLGLLRAVDKFDPQRGVKFATYAHWWVRQAMTRAMMEQQSTIRLPTYVVERKHKLRMATEQLWQVHGREPKVQELGTALGWTPEEVVELQTVGQPMVQLFAPLPSSGKMLADVIEDSMAILPEEQCATEQLQQRLEECLSTLTTREAFVLRRRYGCGTEHPHTLQEIAEVLELSRERVRQVEHGALKKLRKMQGQKALADFVGGTR